MTSNELISKLSAPGTTDYFKLLYGDKPGATAFQVDRYKTLVDRFAREFPGFGDLSLFTTPGRTEVGGNHTDHNAGRVLAAAVDLDMVAVVSPSDDDRIVIHSEGYPEIILHIKETCVIEDEKYTSAALVRGVCARLKDLGYRTGGFRACIDGRVPKGLGLSSSAAFEVMMVTIQNHLYNGGTINHTLNAQIAQYAENVYFGKPCGLMDQTACAWGGLVFIDFKDFKKPVIEKISYDFSKKGYTMVIIDTGGDHTDLNEDYAQLEHEMKSVAASLGGKVLREFTAAEVIENLSTLRGQVSDRALLRALHFFNDDRRVVEEVEALKDDRIEDFISLVRASGASSWMLLQNNYSSRHVETQGISVALAETAQILDRGAWRVHGGGFAGTVQVYIPKMLLSDYLVQIRKIFGEDSCNEIFIRSVGTAQIKL